MVQIVAALVTVSMLASVMDLVTEGPGCDAAYCYWIFLSNAAPGAPGIHPPEGTFRELFNESINYFYINIFLNWAQLPGLGTHAVFACLPLPWPITYPLRTAPCQCNGLVTHSDASK